MTNSLLIIWNRKKKNSTSDRKITRDEKTVNINSALSDDLDFPVKNIAMRIGQRAFKNSSSVLKAIISNADPAWRCGTDQSVIGLFTVLDFGYDEIPQSLSYFFV